LRLPIAKVSSRSNDPNLRALFIVGSLLLSFFAAPSANRGAPDMGWSVHPIRAEFQRTDPIVLAYELLNSSDKDVWVPRSVNPLASVRLRLHDPGGRLMVWTGSRFTFGYGPSDMVKLPPGQKVSGTFAIPRACVGDKAVERGGFCFQTGGVYEGTAEFRLGLNAIYHRDHFQGQSAEGPYFSDKFRFTVR
jgi:hypothetical protein